MVNKILVKYLCLHHHSINYIHMNQKKKREKNQSIKIFWPKTIIRCLFPSIYFIKRTNKREMISNFHTFLRIIIYRQTAHTLGRRSSFYLMDSFIKTSWWNLYYFALPYKQTYWNMNVCLCVEWLELGSNNYIINLFFFFFVEKIMINYAKNATLYNIIFIPCQNQILMFLTRLPYIFIPLEFFCWIVVL